MFYQELDMLLEAIKLIIVQNEIQHDITALIYSINSSKMVVVESFYILENDYENHRIWQGR